MARCWQPDSGARVHLATKPDVDLKFPMAALASSNAFNSSSLPTHFGKSVTEIVETERVVRALHRARGHGDRAARAARRGEAWLAVELPMGARLTSASA